MPAFGAARGRLECVEWDRYNVLKPYAEEYSTLITTRVTISKSKPLPVDCIVNQTSVACPPWEDASKTAFYTTGVEDMQLLVDHGVYGKTTDRIVRSQQMASGLVLNSVGDKIYSICGGNRGAGVATPYGEVDDVDCTDAEQSRAGDLLTIGQLLEAAGMKDGLDRIEEKAVPSQDTARYDGVVLLLLRRYDGRGIDNDMDYTYRVFPLPGLEYKYEEVTYRERAGVGGAGDTATRHVLNRHGVRIILASGGYVAFFSFAELVKTMMIAMGLMSVAKVLVEFFVIRFHPKANTFSRYRYVKTIDFSDYTQEQLEELQDIDYALGTVRNGTKEAEVDEPGAFLGKKGKELKGKLDGLAQSAPGPPLAQAPAAAAAPGGPVDAPGVQGPQQPLLAQPYSAVPPAALNVPPPGVGPPPAGQQGAGAYHPPAPTAPERVPLQRALGHPPTPSSYGVVTTPFEGPLPASGYALPPAPQQPTPYRLAPPAQQPHAPDAGRGRAAILSRV
eukprot:TRINITY_DN8555_c0_g1_i1.p1 TRINITY_DN8555_c0_g1~~TRINITY_DN8555_c0_g1_i1.p1  ORF type:complete len:573 (+),score=182.05 TRINITY_DN8555_c0_g1_i1:212-1720(+)